MAWPNFSLTDLYTALITNLNSRLQDTGKLFNGVTTTGAEFTDQVKYNSSTKKLERWTGSAWVALDMSGTGIASASIATGTITSNLTGNVTGNVTGSSGSCNGNAVTATTATNASGTGTIPFMRYENSLRIVRGKIAANGTILQGSGFSVVRHSPGAYTFDNAFSQAPVVVTNSETGTYTSNAVSVTVTTSGIRSSVYTGSGYTFSDSIINFIATGPN